MSLRLIAIVLIFWVESMLLPCPHMAVVNTANKSQHQSPVLTPLQNIQCNLMGGLDFEGFI